jgi:hypothetical protein
MYSPAAPRCGATGVPFQDIRVALLPSCLFTLLPTLLVCQSSSDTFDCVTEIIQADLHQLKLTGNAIQQRLGEILPQWTASQVVTKQKRSWQSPIHILVVLQQNSGNMVDFYSGSMSPTEPFGISDELVVKAVLWSWVQSSSLCYQSRLFLISRSDYQTSSDSGH